MKRLIAVLLLLCMVFAGCNKTEETVPTTEATTEATTQATTEATEAPTQAGGELYQNPLTGMPTETQVTNRPVAVVINNIYEAQPLHGVGQADVLCEIVAEGGGSITRMLAVYSDISQVSKVGSIRSARTYLLDLAKSFNAIFIHSGGSTYAYNEFNSGGYDHVDGRVESGFYRDKDRQNSGYALEHTLFSSGERLLKRISDKKLKLDTGAEVSYGWQFEETPAFTGETANTVKVRFTSAKGKGTFFEYQEDLGVYFCTQHFYNKHDKTLKDANTDSPLTFRNIIVIKAKTTSDGYRMFAELTGTGEGYYACDGKIVPIKWSRASEKDPFVYSLQDGTLITLGIGTTYVGVVSTNSPISYE